jgi:NAD(P)-dependent dehydrogenase (short-subunit alcohol dehydrogenase family)
MTPARVILITGATSGIGRDAALRLARAGHRVLAGGRRPDALATLAAAAPGGRLEPLRLDVADAASVEAASREVDRRTAGAGLDVLVNNAGYALPGPLEALAEGTCEPCSTSTCSGCWRSPGRSCPRCGRAAPAGWSTSAASWAG